MGVKAPDVADALEIERESYLKMERETWRISLQEAVLIARELGVSVDQLKFPAPADGEKAPESLDAMIEGKSDDLKKLIRGAVKGMIQ
jgi:DNA-binding XRE family transcriptional regulator